MSKWKINWFVQRPTTGSRWYRGNFTLGVMVDSHPRFVHVILGLVFVEIGVGVVKKVNDFSCRQQRSERELGA